MPRLPLRFPSTRAKSPAPRPRPSRKDHRSPSPSSADRRARSHEADRRRRRHSEASRSPPPPRRRHDRDERRESSPSPAGQGRETEHARRRRRDSSVSPERRRDSSVSPERRRPERVDKDYLAEGEDRRRRSSLAPGGRDRRASVDDAPPTRFRPGAARGAFNREGEDDPRRRPSTPDKYKPKQYKERPSSSNEAASHSPQPAASPATARPAGGMFNRMPATIATYAGLNAVTEHADKAKEWIKWLQEMSDTPEEIQDMSAKASTARDTVTQVQQTLKARPDLLADDRGQELKGQIEDAIEGTDKALGRMTKLLSEISKKGADHGDAINGMQDFWRSYRYKDEFKDKVEKADEELQKELTHLSTLMVNVYSRALVKPVSPGAAAAPVPPPAPQTEENIDKGSNRGNGQDAGPESNRGKARDEAELAAETTRPISPKTTTDAPRQSIPTIITPDEPANDAPGPISPPPRSPSTVAAEEDFIGSPPLSAGNDSAQPSHLSTPPTTSQGSDAKPRDDGRPSSRDKRGSDTLSKEQAEDLLLDAAWDGELDNVARALRHVSHAVCDARGLTALHLAAERDNLAVAILLLDRGADPQARSDGGRTPLHLAARSASSSMVEMLVERGGSDANAQTARGRTPLHYAASKAADGDEERREAVRVLRDWGADPTVRDKDGETARDVAQKREHWDAASTLRRAERRWEEEHKQGWMQRHRFMK